MLQAPHAELREHPRREGAERDTVAARLLRDIRPNGSSSTLLRRLGAIQPLQGLLGLPLPGPQLGLKPGVVERGPGGPQHRLDEVRPPGQPGSHAQPGQRGPVDRAGHVDDVGVAEIVRGRRAVAQQVTPPVG